MQTDAGRLDPIAATPVRVVLAGDVVTSYLGALGARPGVVVAAGSGAVALAERFAAAAR